MNEEHEAVLKFLPTFEKGNNWVETKWVDKEEFEKLYPSKPADWEGEYIDNNDEPDILKRRLMGFDMSGPGPEKDYTATQMLEIGGARGGGKTEMVGQMIREEISLIEYISDFNSEKNAELSKKLGKVFQKAMEEASLKMLTSGGVVLYQPKPKSEPIPYGHSPLVNMSKSTA